jgi:hypothetical protein
LQVATYLIPSPRWVKSSPLGNAASGNADGWQGLSIR